MRNESEYMYRALDLAGRGLGHTRPNPPVGAVVVNGGRIVGEGWHRKAGKDHAEVAAIKNALKRLHSHTPPLLHSSTLYVTLEPCSKPGRVGACTDAIAAAGISKVVYAIPDPNPKNRGKARRALAKAGIACECWATNRAVMNKNTDDQELLRRQECVKWAKTRIAPFAKHVATGLPYVTVKIAMSLDGKICDNWGEARWISSRASRCKTDVMRAVVDAIMVGAETVRKDNPSLLCHRWRNDDLVRVVITKSGNLPDDAQVFTDGAPNKTLVFDDAKRALRELGRMGVMHVLCEGGLNLACSIADQGLVDEWRTVLAPIVVGSKPIGKAFRMKHCPCLCFPEPRGDDVIITYGINRPTPFS